MTQTQLNSDNGRGRFFQRLTDTLILIDRQAGQLTDQAGSVILGDFPDHGRGRAGGLVEDLLSGLGEER